MSESLTHSIPRSFLVVALSASAVGFADALWLCPDRAPSRIFASVSLLDPVALLPLLHRVLAAGFRPWCAFRFCGEASPLRWFRRGPWGVAVAPPLSPYTGPGWSRQFAVWLWGSGRCFLFSCATFRTCTWRSFCQFP